MIAHEVVDIEVDRDSHVHLEFADGYQARFDLLPLRRACPCASCRARRDRGLPVGPGPVEDPPTVVDARLVGAWGLGIDWSDGHGTGIYSWEVLRSWAEELEGPPSFS